MAIAISYSRSRPVPVSTFGSNRRIPACIFEIAVLQQAQNVLLRIDPVFGNRDYTDEFLVHGHCGVPALACIFERVAGNHGLIKIRGATGWKPGHVYCRDRLLKDFGCLGALHGNAISDMGLKGLVSHGSNRDQRLIRPHRYAASARNSPPAALAVLTTMSATSTALATDHFSDLSKLQ